jgi:hypothetical protein
MGSPTDEPDASSRELIESFFRESIKGVFAISTAETSGLAAIPHPSSIMSTDLFNKLFTM